MILNRLILLPLFLFLFSCASGVKITSKYCNGPGKWEPNKLNRTKVVMEPEAGFGIEDISIKNILAENGYDCRQITNLSVGIQRSSWDAFISAFPGYSSQTIIIKFDDLVEYDVDKDLLVE
jgi:hypothetical protein